MLNFGHFLGPLFSLCFHTIMNFDHFWASPHNVKNHGDEIEFAPGRAKSEALQPQGLGARFPGFRFQGLGLRFFGVLGFQGSSFKLRAGSLILGKVKGVSPGWLP